MKATGYSFCLSMIPHVYVILFWAVLRSFFFFVSYHTVLSFSNLPLGIYNWILSKLLPVPWERQSSTLDGTMFLSTQYTLLLTPSHSIFHPSFHSRIPRSSPVKGHPFTNMASIHTSFISLMTKLSLKVVLYLTTFSIHQFLHLYALPLLWVLILLLP